MTTTAKSLIPGSALTASVVSYYSPAAGTTAVIKSMTAHNPTAGAVTLALYLIPSGGTVIDAYKIIARSIAAGATDLCPEAINKVLAAGGTIQASGLTLSLSVSGVEIV